MMRVQIFLICALAAIACAQAQAPAEKNYFSSAPLECPVMDHSRMSVAYGDGSCGIPSTCILSGGQCCNGVCYPVTWFPAGEAPEAGNGDAHNGDHDDEYMGSDEDDMHSGEGDHSASYTSSAPAWCLVSFDAGSRKGVTYGDGSCGMPSTCFVSGGQCCAGVCYPVTWHQADEGGDTPATPPTPPTTPEAPPSYVSTAPAWCSVFDGSLNGVSYGDGSCGMPSYCYNSAGQCCNGICYSVQWNQESTGKGSGKGDGETTPPTLTPPTKGTGMDDHDGDASHVVPPRPPTMTLPFDESAYCTSYDLSTGWGARAGDYTCQWVDNHCSQSVGFHQCCSYTCLRASEEASRRGCRITKPMGGASNPLVIPYGDGTCGMPSRCGSDEQCCQGECFNINGEVPATPATPTTPTTPGGFVPTLDGFVNTPGTGGSGLGGDLNLNGQFLPMSIDCVDVTGSAAYDLAGQYYKEEQYPFLIHNRGRAAGLGIHQISNQLALFVFDGASGRTAWVSVEQYTPGATIEDYTFQLNTSPDVTRLGESAANANNLDIQFRSCAAPSNVGPSPTPASPAGSGAGGDVALNSMFAPLRFSCVQVSGLAAYDLAGTYSTTQGTNYLSHTTGASAFGVHPTEGYLSLFVIDGALGRTAWVSDTVYDAAKPLSEYKFHLNVPLNGDNSKLGDRMDNLPVSFFDCSN